MAGFGISPDTLALRPSTLIQDRANTASRAQQASQYQEKLKQQAVQIEQSRQDTADRFAQSMASQEEKRKADFAKVQFQAEQKLLIEKNKLEQKRVDREEADVKYNRNWAKNKAIEGYLDNEYPQERIPEAEEHFYNIRTGKIQAPQAPAQQPPQVNAQQALETEVARMNQYKLKDPYTKMYPTMAGGEQGYALGTADPVTPPAKELTLDEINKQVLSEAVAAKQAQQPATQAPVEIPEAIVKTGKSTSYKYVANQIKQNEKAMPQLNKEITSLEKAINDTAFNPKRTKSALRANLKAKKSLRDKKESKIQTLERELITMSETAQKKLEKKVLKPTYAKSQDIKAVKANLKRDKSINKWGEARTIASLDEALDYIISKNLSPELFKDELSKWGTQEPATQETRNKALQTLQSKGYPITEANIQAIIKQL